MNQSHFINIAYGSLMELFAQADIAHDLKFINDEMFNQIEEQVESISKMIQAMCYLRKSSSAKKITPALSPNRQAKRYRLIA